MSAPACAVWCAVGRWRRIAALPVRGRAARVQGVLPRVAQPAPPHRAADASPIRCVAFWSNLLWRRGMGGRRGAARSLRGVFWCMRFCRRRLIELQWAWRTGKIEIRLCLRWDRQPMGTWHCVARRQQRKLLTRRQNENHGGPRRARGSRSAGLTGPRISQLPQQAHGLRGPPWLSFCLRVKSFTEFRAGTGAACLPVCVCRRESERRGRPRSGPVRELCLDAWVTLRAGRWPPPRPGHIIAVTD